MINWSVFLFDFWLFEFDLVRNGLIGRLNINK